MDQEEKKNCKNKENYNKTQKKKLSLKAIGGKLYF